jgi:hypothetical protein
MAQASKPATVVFFPDRRVRKGFSLYSYPSLGLERYGPPGPQWARSSDSKPSSVPRPDQAELWKGK